MIEQPAAGPAGRKTETFWRATPGEIAAQGAPEVPRVRDPRHITGRFGERLAERYYVAELGATLRERNFHFDSAEIDLLFDHEEDLVAVEVKTRAVEDLAQPAECISLRQLRRIERTLLGYAQDHDQLERSMRIDVIAIRLAPDGEVANFEHLRSVFPG